MFTIWCFPLWGCYRWLELHNVFTDLCGCVHQGLWAAGRWTLNGVASRDSVKAWTRAIELIGVNFQCRAPHFTCESGDIWQLTKLWREGQKPFQHWVMPSARAFRRENGCDADSSKVLEKAVKMCLCVDNILHLKYPCCKAAWFHCEPAEQRKTLSLTFTVFIADYIKMQETHLLVVTGGLRYHLTCKTKIEFSLCLGEDRDGRKPK